MKKKTKIICSIIAGLAIAAFIFYVGEEVSSSSMLRTVLQLGTIYALVAVSMNLLNGFTGLFSLGQAGFMANLYSKHSISPFVPASILADGEVVSCFTPPVFEVWNDRLVAIEGNTRLLYSYRAGLPSISALVVNGVTAQLPGNPVKIQRALLATSHMTSEDRISGFDYSRFRSIEGAARPLRKT